MGTNPSPAKSKKLTKQVVIILVTWFVAMASLLGVHYLLNRNPQIDKAGILKIQAKYNSLSDEDKMKMKYFEAGIIQLANGDLRVVDADFEKNEGNPAAFKGLVWRRIELTLEDPLLLERQTMVKEALKTLNNSERRCFADRHATIVYDKGSYYLVIDPKIYAEYVHNYGTECKSCDDRKTKSTKISGKGR